MADYRQIHVKMWKQDAWFLSLEPMEKLLFIYLFSNECASIAGIYELPLPVIVFETGLEKNFVLATLDEFARARKVFFEDGIVWVVNLRKYNENPSPKVKTRIDKDVAALPDCRLKTLYIEYHSSMQGVSIPILELGSEQEHEQEHEQEQEGAPAPARDPIRNACSVYEQHVGILTGGIASEIKDLIAETDEFRLALPAGVSGADIPGDEWVCEAIRTMSRAGPNRPNVKYVVGIINRWRRDGYKSAWDDDGKERTNGTDTRPSGSVFSNVTDEQKDAKLARLAGGAGADP